MTAIDNACEAVETKKMSLRKASVTYGVPYSTLRRHHNKLVKDPGCLGSRRPVFTAEQEKCLKDHIISMQERFYGLTLTDVKQLAFEVADSLNIPNQFNKETRTAGYDWVCGFLQRNPEVCIRRPESTSIGRAVGFNKSQVDHFYQILYEKMEDHQYSASQIWNADESGVSAVHKPPRILAKKGQKQVGKITSGERGQNVTVLCCLNASNTYIPPMIIFPRKRMSEQLNKGAPSGSIVTVSDNGWITQELFLEWFDHFLKMTKPSKENRQLLIIDGHVSHKSIHLIEKARSNFVDILILPPHTTHRLQPLDRVFYGPLKTNFNKYADRFLINNPGKRITLYEISELFGKAYIDTASMSKCVKGFACTGIYPYDPDTFLETDFCPSKVTVRQVPSSSSEAQNELESDAQPGCSKLTDHSVDLPPHEQQVVQVETESTQLITDLTYEAGPSSKPTEFESQIAESDTAKSCPQSPSFREAVLKSCPLPVAVINSTTKRKRKGQRACFITDITNGEIIIHDL